MAESYSSPPYLHTQPHDIESLANKLNEFCQTLNPIELSLFLERVKRSMPSTDVDINGPISPSPIMFGAWLNAIVDGESRWFPI